MGILITNLEQLTAYGQVIAGQRAISDPEERYRINSMPDDFKILSKVDWKDREKNPLPRGKSALSPTTKAGWPTEALLRAMISNLCHGDDPEGLIIYGGTGQAARNWQDFNNIQLSLRNLKPYETLHVSAGGDYFIGGNFRGKDKPRVIIANSMMVGNWAEFFPQYQAAGMISFGQMTAGSWIYMGFQGIAQGTYETAGKAVEVAEISPKYSSMSKLEQRLMVSEGLGHMSGAQPLAFTMVTSPTSGKQNKIAMIAEVSEERIDETISRGYLDKKAKTIDEAFAIAREYAERDEAISIGVHTNAVDLLNYLVEKQITPHFVTSQSSIHEVLQTNTKGKNTYKNFFYCPVGWTPEQALDKRNNSPKEYLEKSLESVVMQARQMLELQNRGAIVTDYGNFLVGTAMHAGFNEAKNIGGFIPMFVRPLFCEGRGPFRWEVLSNDVKDLRTTDHYAKLLLSDDPIATNWLNLASEYVPVEPGLPGRVVWAGYGGMELPGRAAVAMLFNKLVADGKIKAPIIIGRDQLDGGSVASPQRETREMPNGSDPIATYVMANFASAVMNGATSVAIHDGGGVGVGNSLATNYIALADGKPESQRKLFWILMNDTMSGIMRHAAAGEPKAIEMVKKYGLYQSGTKFDFNYNALYKRTVDIVESKTGIQMFPGRLY